MLKYETGFWEIRLGILGYMIGIYNIYYISCTGICWVCIIRCIIGD